MYKYAFSREHVKLSMLTVPNGNIYSRLSGIIKETSDGPPGSTTF
jgi:hypothetical protein